MTKKNIVKFRMSSLALALVSIGLSSCTSNYVRYNETSKDVLLRFKNKKLNLEVSFFGDYEFPNFLDSKSRRIFRALLVPYIKNVGNNRRHLVCANETTIFPYFKGAIWYLPKTSVNLQSIKKDFYETDKGIGKYYERIDSLSIRPCIVRIYPVKSNFLTIVQYVEMKEQKSVSDAMIYLDSEFHQIYSTIEGPR